MPHNNQLKFEPDAPCPCGRTDKSLRNCCLVSGYLRKSPPVLSPKGPPTNFSNPGCYLNFTGNCSRELSGEHYISKSILELLKGDDGVLVSGVPWLPTDAYKNIGVASLASNILCKRHNETLSPLDSEALLFFRTLSDIHADLKQTPLLRKETVLILSGEALELWMLKAACGLFFSKNASRDRKILFPDISMRQNLIADALYRGKWAHSSCGLYMKASVGEVHRTENGVGIAPLISKDMKFLYGIELIMRGLSFFFILDPEGIGFPQRITGLLHRPGQLRFSTEQCDHTLLLTWPPGMAGDSVIFGVK